MQAARRLFQYSTPRNSATYKIFKNVSNWLSVLAEAWPAAQQHLCLPSKTCQNHTKPGYQPNEGASHTGALFCLSIRDIHKLISYGEPNLWAVTSFLSSCIMRKLWSFIRCSSGGLKSWLLSVMFSKGEAEIPDSCFQRGWYWDKGYRLLRPSFRRRWDGILLLSL